MLSHPCCNSPRPIVANISEVLFSSHEWESLLRGRRGAPNIVEPRFRNVTRAGLLRGAAAMEPPSGNRRRQAAAEQAAAAAEQAAAAASSIFQRCQKVRRSSSYRFMIVAGSKGRVHILKKDEPLSFIRPFALHAHAACRVSRRICHRLWSRHKGSSI